MRNRLAAICASLFASTLFGGCAGSPGEPSATRATATLSTGDDDASVPVDFGASTGTFAASASACSTDTECGPDALCVDHVCNQACRRASECGPGASCNMNNRDGACFNAPGCNPPPPHTVCSTICWGYCDYADGG